VDLNTLASTRRGLHGVAELLLAGPQHRRTGDIRLRVTPGGFGTVSAPSFRVDGADLVAGEYRLPLDGRSYTDVAAEAGIQPESLEGVFSGGPGITPDEIVHVDASAARQLADGFAVGDRALRRFAPREDPVLWPEHFDVAVTVDEVGYGVSPGDSFCAEPYAYVGPSQVPEGAFWNAPFGAIRVLREFGGADAVEQFFREGQRNVR
jgi:hypothetical protein